MNARPSLTDLQAFATIATHRSFRKAADELALAPSTLSHQMRTLEQNLGVRLLHRTTRSVALTQAGEQLLARLQPLLLDLDGALAALDEAGRRPSGVLRINANALAAQVLLARVVPAFLQRHADVTLELATDGRLVDIVAEGFDAGVRLGEALQQDMVAVPLGSPLRFVSGGARGSLAGGRAPRTPQDLLQHDCIRIRYPSGKPYRYWEFARRGEPATVDVRGPLVLDDVALMVQAASQGQGVAYVPEPLALPLLHSGALVLLLSAWCPPIPGLYLYYPGHRHVPPALRAFIDVARELA